MKLEYTGRHIEVTPAIRSHVEKHFDKLKHLFDGQEAKAHVIIEVVRGRHRAEIVLKWRDHILTAKTTLTDMYQALSKTIEKLEKQALKLKNKVIDKHHKAKKASQVAPRNEVSPAPENPKVIKTDSYAVKPLTLEEAIVELSSNDNQFLVFRNADEQEKIAVIYRRKDGNYGLIQP
ncbi:MAG: ribosome-associated translation inhibitor RaiA [Pyrinomonadaceae bacterium]|nr:ribosome-associated translation inhibitor RaiA [Pyrinomonadaceae bacterium]MCX7639739.1 ribosome-associated translation inhibitor RaiA [Pyrinomonadaceae bacterium]MDW8304322.1 ribosome-associated translation inhibitor RaiA [Acidobacteriota bacterium]